MIKKTTLLAIFLLTISIISSCGSAKNKATAKSKSTATTEKEVVVTTNNQNTKTTKSRRSLALNKKKRKTIKNRKTSTSRTKKLKAVKNKNGHLVGIATRKDLKKEPYGSEWFNDYYSYYETDKTIINSLIPKLEGIKIKAFMGTWCGDSKREVPNFYKILDDALYDLKNLELVTVNRSKKAKGLEKGYNIIRVPTFIFYKNGKEIGRFVEHTVDDATLEYDMLQIVSGKGYKHAYEK